MGTRTGQSIVDRAWIRAKDEGVNKRWPKAECLMWVNDWQLAVVNAMPRAYTLSAVVTAESGTRQTMAGLGLPRGLQAIDVPNNVSAAGSPGSPITKCARAFLDERVPTWHQETAAEAQHWMVDDEDPTAFYVYPAISGGGKLRVIHAAMPPDLTSLDQEIALPDIYANSGMWFVLFSFFSKDLSSIKSADLAKTFYSLFENDVGIRDQKLTMSEAKSNAKQQGA